MMKYILLAILLLSFNGIVKAQVYPYVEKQPEFPGGQEALLNFITKNVSYTKEDAEKEGKPQTRNLRFVIDSTGKVTSPLIENKEPAAYTAYDKRLIEMLHKMPRWIPGEHEKKKVSVGYMIPVRLWVQED